MPVPSFFPSENHGVSTGFEDLPENAKSYVRFVEEKTGTPVSMIGVGPDREQTIFVKPGLIWG